MAHEEEIDLISQRIKDALSRQVGRPYDPQKFVETCRNIISSACKCNKVEVRIVEESEEEQIVREVMEEPAPEICIESTIHLEHPLNYVSVPITFDTSKCIASGLAK